MTWTRQPSTAPRLARELGTNPLQLKIGGTLHPWTVHTAVHVSRAGTIDDPVDRPATITVRLVPGAVPAIARGQWLTLALTDAALTAAGVTLAADRAASRCRFVGRVTDVDVDKPGRDAIAVYTVVAVGTIRSLQTPVRPYLGEATSLSAVQAVASYLNPNDPAWTRPASLPADAQWGVIADTTATGPNRDKPSDPATRGETYLDVLVEAARDDGTTMIAEHRDGSIHYKAFATPVRSTTVGKHAAQYRLEQLGPVNDVKVLFGLPTPADGTIVARNIIPNPAPTTTTAWASSNNTASASASGYVHKPTNGAASSWSQQVSSALGSPAGGVLVTVAGSSLYVVGTGVTVVADWYNSAGTKLRADPIGTLPATTGTMRAWSFTALLTPPTGANTVRLTLYVAANATPTGQNTCAITTWSVVTQGPGDIDPAEGERWPHFTGANPAAGGYRYAWAGTAGNSDSRKLANGQGTPRLYARRIDAASLSTHGRGSVTVDTSIAASAAASALTLAGAYLHGPGWTPPTLTVDVLALLEEGSADALATAKAVLALELGDRVTPRALPADIPQDSANAGAAVYIAGIDETISAHDWRLTITLANRVHDLQ